MSEQQEPNNQEDSFQNLLRVFNDRLRSPFFGTFFISLVVVNWDSIGYFLLSDDDIETVIRTIKEEHASWVMQLLVPLVLTIAYLFAFPLITGLANWYRMKAETFVSQKSIGAKTSQLAQLQIENSLNRSLVAEQSVSRLSTELQDLEAQKAELEKDTNERRQVAVEAEKQLLTRQADIKQLEQQFIEMETNIRQLEEDIENKTQTLELIETKLQEHKGVNQDNDDGTEEEIFGNIRPPLSPEELNLFEPLVEHLGSIEQAHQFIQHIRLEIANGNLSEESKDGLKGLHPKAALEIMRLFESEQAGADVFETLARWRKMIKELSSENPNPDNIQEDLRYINDVYDLPNVLAGRLLNEIQGSQLDDRSKAELLSDLSLQRLLSRSLRADIDGLIGLNLFG